MISALLQQQIQLQDEMEKQFELMCAFLKRNQEKNLYKASLVCLMYFTQRLVNQ